MEMSTKHFGEKGEWVTRERKERKGCVMFLNEKKENVNVWLCLYWCGGLKTNDPQPLDFFFFLSLKQKQIKYFFFFLLIKIPFVSFFPPNNIIRPRITMTILTLAFKQLRILFTHNRFWLPSHLVATRSLPNYFY